jgi:selenium metabolism protein YedF
MGHGSEELGRILIQACINTISSLEPQPSAVIFYNGGVEFACEGSPVLSALEEIEKKGIKILVCGTCLDYFSLKEKRKVGVASNMFEILSTLAAAGHIINP